MQSLIIKKAAPPITDTIITIAISVSTKAKKTVILVAAISFKFRNCGVEGVRKSLHSIAADSYCLISVSSLSDMSWVWVILNLVSVDTVVHYIPHLIVHVVPVQSRRTRIKNKTKNKAAAAVKIGKMVKARNRNRAANIARKIV
jgi:hypothetical protein